MSIVEKNEILRQVKETKRKKKPLKCSIPENVIHNQNILDFASEYCNEIQIITNPSIKPRSNVEIGKDSELRNHEMHNANTFFGNKNFQYILKENELNNWKAYNYINHFGAHDWLALNALKIILNDNDLSTRWKRLGERNFWSKERTKLFLYATAAPDYSDPNGKNFIHYQDLCEENGKRSKSWHNMQFNQDKSIKQSIIWIDFKNRIIKYQYEPKYNPAIKAQNWAIEARNYLLLEQHNKCTFSLGAMSHYIADCACFLHVICPYSERVNLKKKTYGEMKGIFNKFKKIHDHYEGNIDMRVESEYGNPPLNLNLDPKSEEFFIINYMSILQNLKNNRMNAYEATLNTASEVVKNAHWMYENYDTIMREQWTLAKVGSHNWRNNFNIQENTLKFLHLVESHLNLAIKNIAFALLSIENI